MSSFRSKIAAIGIAAGVTGASITALGLPTVGQDAPNGKVEDADGKALETKNLKGKPILIVYEDRDSAAQNEKLKKQLGELAKGDKYKTKIALAAVADVSSYDFWPAKGFVKDAIREESKKQGTTIYCDWNASFRKAFKLTKGKSSVVLVGKDGKVLFAGEGSLSDSDRKKLVELLKAQVEAS
ncbi:MAG: YtfJ family protein [Polyangiaceae bacterium]